MSYVKPLHVDRGWVGGDPVYRFMLLIIVPNSAPPIQAMWSYT